MTNFINPFFAKASSPSDLKIRVVGKISYNKRELAHAQDLAKQGRFEEANYILTGAIEFENEDDFFSQFWSEE